MTNRSHATELILLVNVCLMAFLSGLSSTIVAQEGQQQGDGSRQIFAEEFTKERPIKPPTASPLSRPTGGKPRPRYTRTATATTTKATKATAVSAKTAEAGKKTPKVSNGKPNTTTSASAASVAKVGVTIWRLRAPRNADQGARLLVQGEEMVPERVASNAVLRVGDSVFLSVESPREGYLYIIDRELFSDGKMGDPYLIFPTTSTRDGDNRVRPGKLINIPDQNDKPNNFTLTPLPNRSDQVGEVLSIIITSEPLENFTLPDKALPLTPAQVEKWESPWDGSTEQYDLENGAGQTQSQAESDAAKAGDGSRLLTQGEPPPQTVYLVEGKNAKGLLVNVQLRYRR